MYDTVHYFAYVDVIFLSLRCSIVSVPRGNDDHVSGSMNYMQPIIISHRRIGVPRIYPCVFWELKYYNRCMDPISRVLRLQRLRLKSRYVAILPNSQGIEKVSKTKIKIGDLFKIIFMG